MIGDNVGCNGKKRFNTYWQAKRAADMLNKFRDGAKANPYKCPDTHHFHVGNTMGRRKKRQPSRHTLKEIAAYGRSRVPE